MQRLILKERGVLILTGLFIFLFVGFSLSARAFTSEPAVFFPDLTVVESKKPRAFMFFDGLNFDGEDDWDNDWDDDWDDKRSSFVARYNRVEGIHLGMEIKRDPLALKKPGQAFLYGNWGYSFGAKDFIYLGGIEKGFGNHFRFAAGIEGHHLIDTPDRWLVPDDENSLAAFFFREDFHDFFEREGVSFYIMQHFTRHVTLSMTLLNDRLDSLNKNVNWALFGGKKKFRPNPGMCSGELRSYRANLVLDTRNSKKHPRRGWYGQIEGERAKNDFGGEFTFDRVLVDLRRYQPLGYGDGVDLRLRAGSIKGGAPWQRTFHLGGISTLRGYGYKEFPNGPMVYGGNRMLLGQIEFRSGSGLIDDALDLDIFDLNHFILFADAGWVGTTGSDMGLFEGFDFAWSDFKSDVGIALTNSRGDVRLEVARRTDTSEKPYAFMFRINRAF